MIYIAAALYYEAESFIKAFCLKKDKEITFADVFSSDTITLIVSGTGGINSAINIVRLFSIKSISHKDTFINIGICGGRAGIGKIFIINKIKSSYTGKHYYPDIIYKHNFTESAIETFAYPVCTNSSEYLLSDMEAAEIFIAASKFFMLHKIIILKIVSDHNSPEKVTRQIINEITYNSCIFDFIKSFSAEDDDNEKEFLSIKYTRIFSEKLNLTESMKNLIYKWLMYYFINNGIEEKIINFLNSLSETEVSSKSNVKKYFTELKLILLGED